MVLNVLIKNENPNIYRAPAVKGLSWVSESRQIHQRHLSNLFLPPHCDAFISRRFCDPIHFRLTAPSCQFNKTVPITGSGPHWRKPLTAVLSWEKPDAGKLSCSFRIRRGGPGAVVKAACLKSQKSRVQKKK